MCVWKEGDLVKQETVSLVLRLPVEFERQEVEWLCPGSGKSAGLSSGGSGRGAVPFP